MHSACRASLIALAGTLMSLIGCAVSDPLQEMAATPLAPFALYGGRQDVPPKVETPRIGEAPLSLAQCMEIAFQRNPKTRVSWQSVRSSAAVVGQQRSRYMPQLEFTANRQKRKYQDLTEPQDEEILTTYEATFGVTQLLLDGGARRANVDSAQAALRSVAFRHNRVLLDVALEVENAYYNLLAAQSLLDVADKTVQQRTKQLQLAQAMRRSGFAREVEELQAAAEKADAELSIVSARNQLRVARGRLCSAMGVSVSSPVQIVAVPDEVRELHRQDVDALLAEAVRARPALKAAVSELTSVRHQLEAEKAGRLPTLELQASRGWRDTHLLPEKEEWQVAVLFSLPLFTGFQRTYRIRQAEAELQSALAGYERLLRDVELEVWEAYSNVLQADEAIKAAKVFVNSADKSLQAVEKAYQNGGATIVEVIDAQTALTRAMNREVTATLGWYLAVAQLDRAIGRSWDADGQAPQPQEPTPAQAEPTGRPDLPATESEEAPAQ